jgi:anti-anti-sigma factor
MPDDAEPWPVGLFRAEATGDDIDPVIIVDGELDASGTDWLGACVSAVLQRHPTSIAVDAQALSYMDSSGVTTSAGPGERAPRGRRVLARLMPGRSGATRPVRR